MKWVTKTFLVAFLSLAGQGCMVLEAWELSPDFQFGVARDGHLSEVLERIRKGNNVPALAAVSMTSTGIIELAATGLRAVGFPERVTDKDQWHLGSITKSMTATVAARLVEKGRITWDTTIGQAVPELGGSMRKEYRKVTLAQLLRHESGLPRDVPMESQSSETVLRLLPKDMPAWILQDYDPKLSPTKNRLKAAVAVLALLPVGPRGKSEYSNAGLMVAGLMLEKAAGMSFENLFERQLLIPLGMRSTGFRPPGVPGKRNEPWGHWPTQNPPARYGVLWIRATSLRTIRHRSRRMAEHTPRLQDVALFASAHLAGERCCFGKRATVPKIRLSGERGDCGGGA